MQRRFHVFPAFSHLTGLAARALFSLLRSAADDAAEGLYCAADVAHGHAFIRGVRR
mgnify:CR=1 FL=1